MKRVVSIILCIITVLYGFNFKQAGKESFMKNLDKYVTSSQEKGIKIGKIVASQVLINYDGEEVYSKVFGTKTVGGEKVTDNSFYRLFSMTKPVTAVAMLVAYESGKLDIYKNVSDYIPEYKNMKVRSTNGSIVDAKNQIKVYQLISHICGLSDMTGEKSLYEDMINEKVDFSYEEVSKRVANIPLSFEPGQGLEYCTVGFDVCARVIEITTGQKFENYIKENIFDKLGMVDTTFSPSKQQWDRMVALTDVDENGNAIDFEKDHAFIIDFYPYSFHLAGAALCSTASDYMKFARMLLNGGIGDNGVRVLSQEMVTLMQTPVPETLDDDFMPGNTKWGLAVRVITKNDNTLPKGSFGWSGKCGTHFWIDPENKLIAVYMRSCWSAGGAASDVSAQLEKDVMKSFEYSKWGAVGEALKEIGKELNKK